MLNPIGATDSGSKPLLAVAQGLGSKGFLENYGFYAAHSEIRKWLSVERLGGFVKELFGTYLGFLDYQVFYDSRASPLECARNSAPEVVIAPKHAINSAILKSNGPRITGGSLSSRVN